jgi:hypothetical protein
VADDSLGEIPPRFSFSFSFSPTAPSAGSDVMARFTNDTRDFGFGTINCQNDVRGVRASALHPWHALLLPLAAEQSSALASGGSAIRLPELGIKRIARLAAAKLEQMCLGYVRLGWDPRPSR